MSASLEPIPIEPAPILTRINSASITDQGDLPTCNSNALARILRRIIWKHCDNSSETRIFPSLDELEEKDNPCNDLYTTELLTFHHLLLQRTDCSEQFKLYFLIYVFLYRFMKIARRTPANIMDSIYFGIVYILSGNMYFINKFLDIPGSLISFQPFNPSEKANIRMCFDHFYRRTAGLNFRGYSYYNARYLRVNPKNMLDIIITIINNGYYLGFVYNTPRGSHMMTCFNYQRENDTIYIYIKNSWGKFEGDEETLLARHSEGILKIDVNSQGFKMGSIIFFAPNHLISNGRDFYLDVYLQGIGVEPSIAYGNDGTNWGWSNDFNEYLEHTSTEFGSIDTRVLDSATKESGGSKRKKRKASIKVRKTRRNRKLRTRRRSRQLPLFQKS